MRGTAALLLLFAGSALGQVPTSKRPEGPQTISLCQVVQAPNDYDRKQITVNALITHGFEDFHLTDPACSSEQRIWVEIGGTAPSRTMYCCPGTSPETPKREPLKVEGVEIPLVNDELYQSFLRLLADERDTTIRVSVTGHFFAGGTDKKHPFAGYGHMGCCALFALEQLHFVEPHSRSDLDYTAEAGWYADEGCKWNSMKYLKTVNVAFDRGEIKNAVSQQQAADEGGRAWAFEDADRVAREALAEVVPGQPPLKVKKQAPNRRVYISHDQKQSIVVVVTKPYWLTAFAKTPSVVWLATNVRSVNCK